MIMNKLYPLFSKALTGVFLLAGMICFSAAPLLAQSPEDNSGIKSLRSDVGIIGLTANFMSLNSFDRLDTDSTTTPLLEDGSNELEFVLRNVRMISPRLGVGFQVLTSFFVNGSSGNDTVLDGGADSGDDPEFGIGSWGLGPVLRAYPFKTDRFQPYVEADALFGNNLGVGKIADSQLQGGFRVRLGLRAGVAYRITNSFGLFVEGGPDWESPRLFKADARALQLNFGIDLYRFK
jgi:hypothetical protein